MPEEEKSSPSPTPPDKPPEASDPEFSDARRSFFALSLRKLLAPVAAVVERRVQPVANALQGNFPAPAPASYGAPANTVAQPVKAPVVPQFILRPPGALPPEEFEQTCSQCGKCVEVCPVSCIQINPRLHIAGGFPYIIPSAAACTLCDELACMHACPSGALRVVARTDVRIGLAEMNFKTCLRTRGEDCRLCLQACPIGEEAIVISPTTGRVLVKSAGCTGCGMCEQACPTAPASITVKPIKRLEELADE
ncbi:MAG TPA: 4Fe-4S dicluster domain-containing protein [Phycisphaerae bacterium]|nr:4Fe-4S dicluster domain-containing protein [Phycisphaerae bacterium]